MPSRDRIDEERTDEHDPLRDRPQARPREFGTRRGETQRDADEQERGSRRRARAGGPRSTSVPEEPVGEQRPTRATMTQRDDRRVLREPTWRERRALADGGDRRHLRRLASPGRCRRRASRRSPTRAARSCTVRGAEVQRKSSAGRCWTALKSALTPAASSEPADEPEERREHADDERLHASRRSELAAYATLRSSASVANSRMRCATVIESVLKMTNAPDEERDRAEREQEVA